MLCPDETNEEKGQKESDLNKALECAKNEKSDIDKALECAKNDTFWDPFFSLTPEQQEETLSQARSGFDKNDVVGFFEKYEQNVAQKTAENLSRGKKPKPKKSSKQKKAK